MKSPTIYDVAQRAGVSISTVSMVTNRPEKVAESTRQRVMQAIEDLGFVPKEQAIARARRDVGYFGVLAPFTSYPSFAVRLMGVLDVSGVDSSQIVVFDQPSAATSARFLESLPVSRRLDGIIIMSIPLEPQVASRLRRSAHPTVLVDVTAPGFTSIGIDDVAGGLLVAEAFAARGHTRVGFVGERQTLPEYRSPIVQRMEGLRTGLELVGLTLDPANVRLVANDLQAYTSAARDLLTGPDRPTAVLAYSDLIAAACLRAAGELGLRVPEEVAIVGFDDLEWAEPLGLTTVRQPLRESGRLAISALRALIDGTGMRGARTTLPVELVLRNTL